MPSIDSLNWLNTNSLRNYPIKEGKSRISLDGIFTIPTDFVVDLQLAVSYSPYRRYYISKLSNLDDSIIIEISDDTDAIIGTFNIVVSNHWQYKEYFLIPSDEFAGAQGAITVTYLTTVLAQPSGIFTFDLTTTEFETRTVVPALKGINRLTFSNAGGESFSLTGDVVIEARSNLRFKLDLIDSNKIIIDAGNGLGLNSLCDDALKCIKTINGIPPDSEGNFTLDFSDCATLTAIPAGTGLLLEDICCKPCVGCNDIAELTSRLMTTESTLLALRNYYDDLSQLFVNFRTTATYTCACPPP